MKHTTIIGSGFAALSAVGALRKQAYQGRITLIAPKPELFYYPSLIWVPAGLRQESDLTVSLHNFFKRQQVSFQAGRVIGVNSHEKQIQTDDGNSYQYDKLIIASGGRYLKKLSGIENSYLPCEGYAQTKAYSEKLANLSGGNLTFGFSGNPQEPSAMRGGPIFEFLFGIDTLLRQQKRRDKFKLTFFSPAPKPGARMGGKAVERLLAEMKRRDINYHLGHKLKTMTENKVITEDSELDSDLTLFMPGMTGPVWLPNSDLPVSSGGFIQADKYCQVPGCNDVYVAGDAGSYPGPDWLPKQAHMADLQAEAAAKNLIASCDNQAASHVFRSELICIVDSLTTGMLVYRDQKRSLQMQGRPFQWAKRLFEWKYLRPYRR